MSKIIKRLLAVILCIIMVTAVTGCTNNTADMSEAGKEEDMQDQMGLRVGSDGIFYLNNTKIYAMGFNWHGGFSMALNKKQRELLPEYFEALKETGVPFVRTMLGAFYASDIKVYKEQRDKFFDAMDYFVELAEQYHVGIVASFWCIGSYAEYCGENFDQIANPQSKTAALIREMFSDIVTRYKNSPAIWAWEIANEGNLCCEVSQYKDTTTGQEYVITSEIIRGFYSIAGEAIRKCDPYRMITNGDGGLRGAWKSLKNGLGWFPRDTEADYDELFEYFTPGAVDSFSIHYPEGESLKSHVDRSRKLGLGLFIGEFHSTKGFTKGLTDSADTEEREGWEILVQQMLDADVQLMCHWCWGRCVQQWFDGTSVELGMYTHDGEPMYQNYYVWNRVRDINWDFVMQGKNRSSEYWLKYEGKSFKDDLK